MVRVPAQQPKMTSRIKCFVWNWLRKYAQVHEGNDVDSIPPPPPLFVRKYRDSDLHVFFLPKPAGLPFAFLAGSTLPIRFKHLET